MTQLKIEYNPYARAFRDSVPSETTSEAVKKGGRSPTKTVSPPQYQPLPSSNIHISEESDTSVESGNCCTNTYAISSL